MKFYIKSTQQTLEIEGIRDSQVRWEFFKYEIRKFSIEFQKLQVQNTKREKMFLENKIKKLENNTNYIENSEYVDCRNKLDKIYEQEINGMRIRSNKIGTNTVKSLQNLFLVLKNLELHKTKFEILQKIKPYMS